MSTRTNVSAMIRSVEDGNDYVIQGKGGGKPLAIVLPYEKYEDLIAAYAELQIDGRR
ncbi:hypothetical protein PBI_MOZY_47 [Mycobacterium phage Mozy]|uniref:Antitoxin n=1 Tax=Mycobacterium phage Mozy TaxID=2922213 RepID=G1D4G1_9CAUD|nr:hypothetical protein FGG28_gp047 [Mycobacterium phage Mozy]AEK09661.1 hypothetical protein PBI_MOZY_47 [Mycobacterium phage Mozy]